MVYTTSPIHRVNAQVFTITPIDEEQLFENVKRIYKEKAFISTSEIMQKFNVAHEVALKILNRVVREE